MSIQSFLTTLFNVCFNFFYFLYSLNVNFNEVLVSVEKGFSLPLTALVLLLIASAMKNLVFVKTVHILRIVYKKNNLTIAI
jgi:hypothetical protein